MVTRKLAGLRAPRLRPACGSWLSLRLCARAALEWCEHRSRPRAGGWRSCGATNAVRRGG